jgi:HD-GYP domain-containing protein (c-di-GMP phosphodiesterase class II)
MSQLRAVAQIVTHQTEWWNGTGEPAGLAGDEIPLESRILGLVADFQWRLAQARNANPDSEENLSKAIEECRQQQGDRFDPKLVETLSLLVMGMQQGLTLPVTPTKVTAGMWLLDANLYAGTAVQPSLMGNG